jgi:hypothetical protein
LNQYRSESRSGFDKSIKKDGAGAHSWGNPLEDPAAYVDEDDNAGEIASGEPPEVLKHADNLEESSSSTAPAPSETRRRVGSLSISYTSEDIALAKEYRKGVFSGKESELFAVLYASFV